MSGWCSSRLPMARRQAANEAESPDSRSSTASGARASAEPILPSASITVSRMVSSPRRGSSAWTAFGSPISPRAWTAAKRSQGSRSRSRTRPSRATVARSRARLVTAAWATLMSGLSSRRTRWGIAAGSRVLPRVLAANMTTSGSTWRRARIRLGTLRAPPRASASRAALRRVASFWSATRSIRSIGSAVRLACPMAAPRRPRSRSPRAMSSASPRLPAVTSSARIAGARRVGSAGRSVIG